MPRVAHIKKKESLALALRIKKSNKEAEPCSYCLRLSRRCLLDRSESSRCSEYVRSRISCDSRGPKASVVRKQVCWFFMGPMRRPRREAQTPVVLSPCLPAFSLDFEAFGDVVDSLRVFDLPLKVPPFDPSDPFWSVFVENAREGSSHSIGSLLVPMCRLFRCILSI